MNNIFYSFFGNIKRIFSGRNLIWHGVMIAVTAALVASGADWRHYTTFRGTYIAAIGFSAAILGFLIPVILPLALYIASAIKKNGVFRNAANASIQAGLLGLGISSLYKVFTGRPGLPRGSILDSSHVFQFGFYRGGAFQGWPSSHTAVAFAMSFAIITLFPKKKALQYILLTYALYIGFGVSVSIHWLSDAVAGAILGTVIGIVVGKSFLERIKNTDSNTSLDSGSSPE